jgi:hypothetical protein
VFKLYYLINKLRELINKSTHDILCEAGSTILATIVGSGKSQTRREAGTESHGSLLKEKAGLPGIWQRGFFYLPVDAKRY